MKRYLLILSSLLIITACEDKKSSTEKIKKTSSEISHQESLQDSTPKQNKRQEKKEERPEGPLLVQTELIPKLTEFGKNHPEDKFRIKTRFGNIDIQLFHDTPLHRANFLFLVKQDYFNDTFFHRVAEGFVIQGGNSDLPSTNQKRHYIGNYLIPSEFKSDHPHIRGAFSAAKYAEQNVSKASHPYEFFIVQSENGAHHLDNEHTVFGQVIAGMDVVDSINKVRVGPSEWPLRNIYMDVIILE